MTEYVKFTERNDHEGETWVFWLQDNGNEEQLEKLSELLQLEVGDEEDEDGGFELDLETSLERAEVDVLTTHGGGGYMAYHTRVDGKLTIPEDIHSGRALSQVLYKGGIKILFQVHN